MYGWLSFRSIQQRIQRNDSRSSYQPKPTNTDQSLEQWVVSATVTAGVKAKDVAHLFRAVSAVVEDFLLQNMTDEPWPSLPWPEYIDGAANRLRQQFRPKDLEDPDFFHSDVWVRGLRHLRFATGQQPQFLSLAKSWYITITFKPC